MVIIGLIAAYFIWDGIARAIHQSRGREIIRVGTDFLAVLDSCGPIEPATGHRDQTRLSDLWDDDNDPTRQWTYFGEATYRLDADSGDKTPDEAHEAFLAHVIADGWKGGQESDWTPGQYTYTRGEWTLRVYYHPEAADHGVNRVAFDLESPFAGGPRVAQPESPQRRTAARTSVTAARR